MREDPSRREQVASRAHEGGELAAEAVEAAHVAQREWRRLPARRARRHPAGNGAADRRAQVRAGGGDQPRGGESADGVDRRGRGGDRSDRDVLPPGRVVRRIRDAPRAAVARRAQHGRSSAVRRFRRDRAFQLPLRTRVRDDGRGSCCRQRRRAEAAGGGAAVGRCRRPPARRVGRARGVVSLVHGGPTTGEALVASTIDGVAFTGSAEVGREIGRRLSAGPFPKPVLAEMGGKNPAVVGASADLEAAAEGIAKAAFGFSGQKCSACSRAIVVDEVHDELVERLAAIAVAYNVGDPADPTSPPGRS